MNDGKTVHEYTRINANGSDTGQGNFTQRTRRGHKEYLRRDTVLLSRHYDLYLNLTKRDCKYSRGSIILPLE